MLKLFSLVLLLLSSAFQATSQDMNRARQIESAWRSWAQTVGIVETSIAIGYDGAFVRASGIGREPNEPAEIASLSKAITAMCMADVLKEQGLSFATRLGDILQDLVAGQNADITIAELVSQSSGLDIDQTQEHMQHWRNETGDRHRDAAEIALARGARASKVGDFFYNNENYAVLGWLISELTEQPYIEACSERVFNEGGLELSPRWGAFAAWGGLQISAEDYLSFVHRSFGSKSDVARAPVIFPNVEIGRGKHYGMGSFWRASRAGGFNFWHFGRLCFRNAGNAGAYFASYGGQWAVVVNYEGCITSDQQSELDTVLWHAAND